MSEHEDNGPLPGGIEAVKGALAAAEAVPAAVDLAAERAKRGRPAKRRAGTTGAGSGPPPADDSLPVIVFQGGKLGQNVRDTLAALRAATAAHPFEGCYRLGERLMVRPIVIADGEAAASRARTRPAGAVLIHCVEEPWLRAFLADHARIEKFDIRRGERVVVNAPASLTAAVLAAAPWPGLAELKGIVAASLVRPDGSVLARPGYDEATRLLFVAAGTDFPAVPARPTRDDALAALETLRYPLCEFPFCTPADESVALAAILTAIQRKVLDTAPAFAFSAPKAGSGKSLLARVPALVATGRDAYLVSPKKTPAETEKELFAALIEGPAVLLIDNIEGAFESEFLCAMLTTPEISGRLLGQSKTVSVNTATTLCYTGNNLQIVGDLVPRTLLCRIDAATEHPDQRQFGIDLDEYIPQQRGALVSAALTVILAYVGAGSPAIPGAPLLSRFSLWDGMVRRPLLWLGMADPLATRATMEAADSRRELHRSIMEAWHDRFGDEAVTVKDLIAAAEPLSEHLAALALRGSNAPSKRSLGRYFARHENVIEAGLRIERGGKDTTANVETWRCIRVVERPADEG